MTKHTDSPRIDKQVPLRMCIACREMKPKDSLFRIVKNKNGEISLHLMGHMEGRGLYICKNRECINRLPKCGKSIYKAFSTMLPHGLAAQLEGELDDK